MAEQSLGRETPLRTNLPRLQRPGPLRPLVRRRVGIVGLLLLSALLLWAYQATRPTYAIPLQVNGRSETVQSRQRTVGGLLREQGYHLTEQDIVYPPLAAPLSPAEPITVILAREMTVAADGRTQRFLTHTERVGDLLAAQQVTLGPQDAILLNGLPVSPDAALPLLAAPADRPRGELTVVRARPIEVEDDGVTLAFSTRAVTLGEALLEQSVLLYEGDSVTPALNTRIHSGMKVRIHRTMPVILNAEGHTIRTRTRAATVQALLTQQGLTVRELDILTPAAETALTDDLRVTLTRIDHEWLYEREAIPYEVGWEARADMELDTQGLVQVGAEGSFARETLIIYENGVERERVLQREFVERAAQDEIHGYGTKIVLRTIQTPEGPRQYWRRIRMVATSYTAATSGKSRDHPAYGITRTGVMAGFGVVAVDPRVVALRSYLYVPGYGVGFAGDTGGAIKGRRIDLGYDEWNLRLWYNPVDVYLLAPAPPPDQIRYIIP